ncbi:H(+)/Cl(-) exchange transporter ClcA [Lactobacillus helveticus]|nr:H(+)/Cl(-) exchange transporter ClcA [Lactobacillus helveticus]
MIFITFILGKITAPYLDQVIGSGVPQIEAIFLNENQMPWWSILWRKFIGGLLAICPGLMLGREGPCIEMGAMISQGLAEKTFKTDAEGLKEMQECGVAAGLAAAFSAPIAGALFLVEEISFSFKPRKVISILAATFSADFVTILFFGNKPCLYLPVNGYLPVKIYWSLPLIGIALGLLAYLYQYVLLSLKPWFNKIKKLPATIIPFVLIIPVGLWNARLLGGSHVLIDDLFNNNLGLHQISSWSFITIPILLFMIRFIFSMLSYGSSVPGGIFMPILVLGALLGIICANLLIKAQIIAPMYYPHILVISMAAYFGAIEKAPFAAIMLLTEMVGTIDPTSSTNDYHSFLCLLCPRSIGR